MIHICPGDASPRLQHPPLTLRDDHDGNGLTDYENCQRCVLMIAAEHPAAGRTERQLTEYATYLQGPLDPRD